MNIPYVSTVSLHRHTVFVVVNSNHYDGGKGCNWSAYNEKGRCIGLGNSNKSALAAMSNGRRAGRNYLNKHWGVDLKEDVRDYHHVIFQQSPYPYGRVTMRLIDSINWLCRNKCQQPEFDFPDYAGLPTSLANWLSTDEVDYIQSIWNIILTVNR